MSIFSFRVNELNQQVDENEERERKQQIEISNALEARERRKALWRKGNIIRKKYHQCTSFRLLKAFHSDYLINAIPFRINHNMHICTDRIFYCPHPTVSS